MIKITEGQGGVRVKICLTLTKMMFSHVIFTFASGDPGLLLLGNLGFRVLSTLSLNRYDDHNFKLNVSLLCSSYSVSVSIAITVDGVSTKLQLLSIITPLFL